MLTSKGSATIFGCNFSSYYAFLLLLGYWAAKLGIFDRSFLSFFDPIPPDSYCIKNTVPTSSRSSVSNDLCNNYPCTVFLLTCYISISSTVHKFRQKFSLVSGAANKMFTRNPAELKGELVDVSLTKTVKGLGFTLIGSDEASEKEEFLQIKHVIVDGPAFLDGRLRTGTVREYFRLFLRN